MRELNIYNTNHLTSHVAMTASVIMVHTLRASLEQARRSLMQLLGVQGMEPALHVTSAILRRKEKVH